MGDPGVGLGTGYFVFVESELSRALLFFGCHREKHRLLCNKIIQEETFPRKIFRVKKQTANWRIHEELWSPPRPPPLLLHLKVLVFILWRLRGRTLSPHYFCVFLPDRGEKQNQCLRMECVVGCWDVSDGCCGCFILYFSHRQFLEQVETSVISVKRQCIHRAEPRGHEATRPRGREAARA